MASDFGRIGSTTGAPRKTTPAENGVDAGGRHFGVVHHNTEVIKWDSRSTTSQQQQQQPPSVNPPRPHSVLHA